MADIAGAADVAVQTVYFTFHTKSELLSRAYDFAVLGEGDPVPPEEQPWYAGAIAEPRLLPALTLMVEGIAQILARATPLDTVVRAGGASDPDTARIRALHEGWRAEGYRRMVDVLSSKAPLRHGVTPERATELLLFYVGMDVHRVLVIDFGWPLEDWIAWTVTAIAEQAFDVNRSNPATGLAEDA
jgi:AcrR family transcriptional regulator